MRVAFSRDFKKKGMIPLSTYLKQYKVGDVVDVVANGAVQKGMVRWTRTGIIVSHRHADTLRSPTRSTTARLVLSTMSPSLRSALSSTDRSATGTSRSASTFASSTFANPAAETTFSHV